ncbi:MAG TPA: hypothetical protein VLB50_01920 [Ignavibacteriaceae bacterium]|nr:hypothetical protein [Ignavibacteriaceae bacterium]
MNSKELFKEKNKSKITQTPLIGIYKNIKKSAATVWKLKREPDRGSPDKVKLLKHR